MSVVLLVYLYKVVLLIKSVPSCVKVFNLKRWLLALLQTVQMMKIMVNSLLHAWSLDTAI